MVFDLEVASALVEHHVIDDAQWMIVYVCRVHGRDGDAISRMKGACRRAGYPLTLRSLNGQTMAWRAGSEWILA